MCSALVMMPSDRSRWALLVLAAARGEAVTRVQLQKALFLIERRARQLVGEGYYEFVPHHYGPFAQAVYDDAEQLVQVDFAQEVSDKTGRVVAYRATQSGIDEAAAKSSAVERRQVESVVSTVRAMSFDQLLTSVYSEFPEMRTKSKFVGRFGQPVPVLDATDDDELRDAVARDRKYGVDWEAELRDLDEPIDGWRKAE